MAGPEQERERITSLYSGMSDGELEGIAHSGDDLTEIATEALKAEISRRHIDLSLVPPGGSDSEAPVVADSTPHEDGFEFEEAVTLRKFRDLPEALLAKGSLESAGIQCYLIDENMVRMDWFISNLLGGIKLQVNRENVEAANEILNQPIPDSLEVVGIGNYDQPTCPQCRSLDVSYRERLKGFMAAPDALLWTCHSCNNEWEESENSDPPEHNRTSH